MNLREIGSVVFLVVVTANVIILVPRWIKACPKARVAWVAVGLWIFALLVYVPMRVVPRWRFLAAAASGDIDFVRRKLAEDASLLTARGFGDYTALHYAAYRNRPEMVEFLVERGADMEDSHGVGAKPLGIAVFEGHYDCVALMLRKGVDPNQRSMAHKSTALHIAVVRGHVDIAKLLLEHGADPRLGDLYGHGTPFSDAKTEEMRDLLGLEIDKPRSGGSQ